MKQCYPEPRDLPPVQATTRSRPEETQVNEVRKQLTVAIITGSKSNAAALAIAKPSLPSPRCGVEQSLVASAGSRDRNAIVQQWITVPKAAVENPGQLKGVDTNANYASSKCAKAPVPLAPNTLAPCTAS